MKRTGETAHLRLHRAQAYDCAMIKCNAFHFCDLEVCVRELLTQEDHTAMMRRWLALYPYLVVRDKRWQACMRALQYAEAIDPQVDEFQDNSVMQFDVLCALAPTGCITVRAGCSLRHEVLVRGLPACLHAGGGRHGPTDLWF
jgi:hypothetical protein